MTSLTGSAAKTQPPVSTTERRVPGEVGTWVFLLGDMLMFGVYFAYFVIERAKAPEIFESSRQTLHIGIGLTNTVVLLISSLCVVIAIGGIRTGARTVSTAAVAVAIAFGVTFVALKVYEYTSLISAGHNPGANRFYLLYFIFTVLTDSTW